MPLAAAALITRPLALLVDAPTYLYRAYFAIRSLMGRDGSQVNAVYGFTRTLVELLEKWRPEYAAAAFDAPSAPSFRAALYPEYKATRPAPPERLAGQWDLAIEAAGVLGIAPVRASGFEADDVLATLARRLCARGIACVVVGEDKDLAQLVTAGVWLYPHGRGEPMDAAAVEARYGVRPQRIPDLLALRGDPIDHIPGVPGIGPKTARRLLAGREPFDRLPDGDAVLRELGPATAAALRQGREQFRANRALTTLRDDVPLDLPDDALVYRGIKAGEARAFCDRFGFDRLRDRILELSAAS